MSGGGEIPHAQITCAPSRGDIPRERHGKRRTIGGRPFRGTSFAWAYLTILGWRFWSLAAVWRATPLCPMISLGLGRCMLADPAGGIRRTQLACVPIPGASMNIVPRAMRGVDGSPCPSHGFDSPSTTPLVVTALGLDADLYARSTTWDWLLCHHKVDARSLRLAGSRRAVCLTLVGNILCLRLPRVFESADALFGITLSLALKGTSID